MKSLFALNKYIWRYKRHLLPGIFFVILSNIFIVFPPQVVRESINMVRDLSEFYYLSEGFEARTGLMQLITMSLFFFGGLVVILAVIRGVFLFFVRQTLIVMSRKVEYDLRNDLYDHYQSLSLSFYRKNRTGDLMARISEDISRVRMYLGPGIMYTINTITLGIIVVVTMLTVNVELTLYALIPLPVLSLAIYYVESIVHERSDKIQRQLSKLTAFTQEMFSGIRIVKAYVREKDTNKKFSDESREFHRRSMRLVKVNSLFQPLVIALVGVSMLLTVWLGGEKVISGTFSLGNIAEFLIYINLLTWPIIAIGWVTTLIQRAAASQDRINEIMNQKSEIVFPTTGRSVKNGDVRFEHVSYKYEGTGIQAIEDVSFHLPRGQKLGIIGPTGSGKSTLCDLIPRLLDSDSGKIYIDHQDIRNYTRDGLRSAIGYAPQDVFLFSAKIRENIAFGEPDATEEEIIAAAEKADVWKNIQAFPNGLDTISGERGVTLSGGQKQRTALARAWIRNPLILILDDSLSAVDTRTEETILSNLRRARNENPDMSVIMVSHRISAIQDSDLIIVLEDGKITERGSHEELIKNGGYYAKVWKKQLLEAEIGSN